MLHVHTHLGKLAVPHLVLRVHHDPEDIPPRLIAIFPAGLGQTDADLVGASQWIVKERGRSSSEDGKCR